MITYDVATYPKSSQTPLNIKVVPSHWQGWLVDSSTKNRGWSIIHATGHHPFEGIMSFRDKSKLGTAQSVKNRTSPTKSTIKTFKTQNNLPVFCCQTWKAPIEKKAAGLSDSRPFAKAPPQSVVFGSLPRLGSGMCHCRKPQQIGRKKQNHPRSFQSTNVPTKRENIENIAGLPVSHYFSWKQSWVFRGSIELLVFFFSWEMWPEWTGTPSIGGVERWFLRPRTLAFARRPCRGYIGSPNEMVEDIQVKNDGILYSYMGVSLNGGTPKTPQNDHF